LSPIEIRPLPPEGRELYADRMTQRQWLLRADPDAGTLTFTEDRPLLILPVRTLTFPLPSTGRPDAVQSVCPTDYRWVKSLQTGISWRLLFLDKDNCVLGWSHTRDEPKASQMWPERLFTPLESLGISVTSEQYATEKAFKRAHPRASPRR
jgi:hypothetical protein